jgi:hypothetical protein
MEHQDKDSLGGMPFTSSPARTRIQMKQDREIEALRQLKLQTRAVRASRTVNAKSMTAPATPLNVGISPFTPASNSNQSTIGSWAREGELSQSIESLQARLDQLQTGTRDSRREGSTQTGRSAPKTHTPIPSPQRVPRRAIIDWSTLLDSVISSN